MNYFYNSMNPQTPKAWRSANEIEISALQHEERRCLMVDENTLWAKPQTSNQRAWQQGFTTLLKTPWRLLQSLLIT